MRGCVVTGIGVICSIGNDAQQVWTNSSNGISGISEISSFDTSGCRSDFGAEVKNFEFNLMRNFRYKNRMDRVSILGIKAVDEAIIDAELCLKQESKERIGVIFGSCVGGGISVDSFQRAHIQNHSKIDKLDILRIPLNTIARNISYYLQSEGMAINIGNACAAGTMSIGYGCELISSGKIDIAVVGGSDAMAPLPFAGFNALQALDPSPCSPFSNSSGITLGEGAACLILESEEHAQKRNAKIYCRVVGYGVTSSAYHITAPHPEGDGQIQSMQSALAVAQIEPSEIEYINAHGTGTPLNDSSEVKSIIGAFKECKDIKISSNKSMIGHCLGAAGTIEAAITIKAMQNSIVPPTINFSEDKISNSEFNFVPNKSQPCKINVALSNSFAFGGNNAAVIFKGADLPIKKEKAVLHQKVYITGIGIVSPIGMSRKEYWDNIGARKSGIVQLEKGENHSSNYAGMVPVQTFTEYIKNINLLRKTDRLTKLLLIAGKSALQDAMININEENTRDTGIVVGTSDGPGGEIASFQEQIIKEGLWAGDAFSFPNTVYNAAGGYLSIAEKIKGYTITLVNGISSGLDSICHSYDILKVGKQKCILACGADEYSNGVHFMYDQIGALGDIPNVEPYKTQEGFIFGEGATVLCLESETACQGDKKRYAEIVGYGIVNTPIGTGKLDSRGNGLSKAIDMALKEANLSESQIDAIVGFANGGKARKHPYN